MATRRAAAAAGGATRRAANTAPAPGAARRAAGAPAGGATRRAGARSVDMNKVREHHEQLSEESTRFGDVVFWEPWSGPRGTGKKNYTRLLPPWSDDNVPFKDVAYHYGVVPKKALVCPRKTYNEACPICEAADAMFATGRDEDKEIGKKLNSRRRYFYNMIDRDDEDSGVQVFGCGITIHRAITGLFNDPDWGDITDPDEGFDVIIERKGEKRDTEYPIPGQARRMPSPLGTAEQMDEWLGGLFDLDALVKREPYEDLKLALEDPEEYLARKEAAEKAKEEGREDTGGPARRTGSAGNTNTYDALLDRAEELGITWEGQATERDLREWIADEESKRQPPPAARTAAQPPAARRAAAAPPARRAAAGGGDAESLTDEINNTLGERAAKRR